MQLRGWGWSKQDGSRQWWQRAWRRLLQIGFLLVSIASTQSLFSLTLTRNVWVFLVASDPSKSGFFVWLHTYWMQSEIPQHATLHFDMTFRLSVSPGSQTPCKYHYGKYFTCIACGPLHKTLRDQRPRLTGSWGHQLSQATAPTELSATAGWCSTSDDQSTLSSSVNPKPIFNYGWRTYVLTETLKRA